jgi:hypothetical protein
LVVETRFASARHRKGSRTAHPANGKTLTPRQTDSPPGMCVDDRRQNRTNSPLVLHPTLSASVSELGAAAECGNRRQP